jgi:lambda family phage portal protein
VAYHLLRYHPGDTMYNISMGEKYNIIPAENMLHCFLQERAGQARGVPPMSVAISSLKMLHGYREAELVAARVGASKMGFFTSPAGDGFTADDTDQRVPIMEAEPGTFHQLPDGVTFQEFDPSHPNSAFADFEKAILRGIASGLGVSYTSLANDLEGVSYSSIRQGTLEDRDNWKLLQSFLIQHFVEPVYRRWLMAAMENGAVNLPATRFDKFADATIFRARGWQWVDPLKEINAAVVGLNNGIMSLQDVANHYGRDVEETMTQIRADKELAADFGLKFAFEPFGEKLPAQAEVSDADNNNT